MKLKKLLAGVTAAAMAVGLVAVTPLMTSAAPDTSHITGDPYIIVDGHGRYYGLNLRTAAAISEGTETYHFETTTATYDDNFLETTATEDGKEVIKSGELAVYFYDYGATLSDYEATLTINGEVIATSTTATADGSKWDYIAEANVAVGGRKSISLADKTTDVEMNGAKVEVDVTVTCVPAAPVGGTKWTKNSNNSYSFTSVAKPADAGETVYGASDICPNTLEAPYSDYLTDEEKALVREVKIITDIGQYQYVNGYAIVKYLDEDKKEATTYVEGTNDANWEITGGKEPTTVTVTFQTPNGVTGDSIELQTWYMNYSTSVTVKFEFILEENIPVTGVTLNKTSLSLKKGENATLTATVTPTDATVKTVTWTSSNTAVATVDENGKVTAKAAGEATITATAEGGTNVKATATVTVTAAITTVTPTINVTNVTVNGETLAAQTNEIKGAVEVTIEGLTENTDFTTSITFTDMAGESDSTATVNVALTEAGAKKYAIAAGKDSFPVTVKFVNLVDSEYQGYTANTTVDIEATEDDTDDTVKAAVQAAIEARTVTLKGADAETANKSAKIGDVMSDMTGLSSIKAKTGSYTVTVDVNVYGIIRQGKDLYYPEDVTIGDSKNAISKITLTFTVNVTAPESEDPEDPTPVDPTPVDPTPVDPTPVDPTPVDPTPVDPAPVDPTPSAPNTPIAIGAASVPRVGDAVVSTDVNTGAAFTGTRAMEEVSRAKSGDVINIVMTPGMSEGEIIAKIAYKKNVTVNLKYSAYSVSINSDDVAENFEAKGFYSTSRFLSADEKAAFAGTKELRQVNVKNLDGVEKATVTVTMRGGSKGMDATALNRISAGKFKTVATGKVGEDRTFSFEITRAGNYVVYAGKVDMGE